jgi:hypothetical protein
MAILVYKTNCNAAASVANVAYILRDDACQIWSSQHIDIQSKSEALSYAERRQWEEDLKPLNGAAQRRNHQRMELSFVSETDPQRALEIAESFVKRKFPQARAILAAHTNTKNLHVHVWLDNRTIDENKVHLSNSQYKRLGDHWAKFTDRIYGTNNAEQFQAKRLKNIAERQELEASGRSTEIVRAQNTEWKIKKERELQNEQRTIIAGEFITSTAGRAIDQSARTIHEAVINRQLELEAFTRQSLERGSREVAEHDNATRKATQGTQITPAPKQGSNRAFRTR